MAHFRAAAATGSRLADFVTSAFARARSSRQGARVVRRRLREIAVRAPSPQALRAVWAI